ncbi:hypothetical protein CBL_02714 [Carabus blaptoides fortunei]
MFPSCVRTPQNKDSWTKHADCRLWLLYFSSEHVTSMQSSQVRNVGLDLVPSTSGPSHDTPKELPLWMLDPKQFPLDWLTFNRSNIVRCTKEYTRELVRWRRCQQYSTASRLKGVLKRIMMFLHTHMRYVDGKNLIDCELEEELITLVSMYADMELKVWLKKREGLLASGEQAAREYQRRSTNNISHWLYTMLGEHAHRVDTLLSLQTLYSRHTRPVLDPIFRKVLWEITDTSLTDVTYVRYMLAYKLWHERVLVAEDDTSRALTEHLVNHLVPLNNYTRFSPALRGCLCKTPRNVDNVARIHMIPNNINLRKACDDFLKHCRVPLDEINFGSISLIDDDFEDMLSDEDAEVKELMKLISDRQEAKETKNSAVQCSRGTNNAPVVSFVDLTEPEPITQASTSRETSSTAFIDLTSDDDEKPTAQPSTSPKKSLVTPPTATASSATKSPMMEACCGRPYREEEDVYMHPNLVNFIFMCPLRRREYGRSKLEIRHMCQETKARCGCMKSAPAEDKHTTKMSTNSFEDMSSCFQFAKTEEFSYMNEDEVDDEDLQPPQVLNHQQQQHQQQALMIKRESLPATAADNVMCNNNSGQEVIDCDADDDQSFCDTLFSGSLTVCDKNNSSGAERTYGKCVSELTTINKHVELTCERLHSHTPTSVKHNSATTETSPVLCTSATKSTPPESNILGTYSRRLSEKLDKRKVLQQSGKSNSCRREIKFSPTVTADDEKTLNCHTHEEIRRIKLPVLECSGPKVQTELVDMDEQQQQRLKAETTSDILNRLTLPQTEPNVSPETGQIPAEMDGRLLSDGQLCRAPSPVTETLTRRSPEMNRIAETPQTDVLSRLTLSPETERSLVETESSSSVTEKSIPHESTIESIPCSQTETLTTESEISADAETLSAEEMHDKRLVETENIDDVSREVDEIITATEEISLPENTVEAEIVIEQLIETMAVEETPFPATTESVTEEHPETFSGTEVVEETVDIPSIETVAENHELLNYETSEVVPEAVPEICVETEIVSNYQTPEIITENSPIVSEHIVESFEVPEFVPVAEIEVTADSTDEQLPLTENTERQPETLPNTDLLPETEESLTVPVTIEAEIVENEPEEMTRTQSESESLEEVIDEVTISLAENVDSPAELKESLCSESEITTETIEITKSACENLIEDVSVTETVQENLVPPFPAEILPETSTTEELHTAEMVEIQSEEIIQSEIQTSTVDILNCDMVSEETVITTSYTAETVHEPEIQSEVIFPEECSEIEISSVEKQQDSDDKEVSVSVESVIEPETVVFRPATPSNSFEKETQTVLEHSAPEEQTSVNETVEKFEYDKPASECLITASAKRRRKSPITKIRKDYTDESQLDIEQSRSRIEDARAKHEDSLAATRRLSPASSNQFEKNSVEFTALKPEETVLPSPARRGRPRKTPVPSSSTAETHGEEKSSCRVVEETDFVGRLRSRRKTDLTCTIEPVTEVLLKDATPMTSKENTETVALVRRRKPGPASSKLRYGSIETQAAHLTETINLPEQPKEDVDQAVEGRSGLKHLKHRRKQIFKGVRNDSDTRTLSKVTKKSESRSDIETKRRLVVSLQNLSDDDITNLLQPTTTVPISTDISVKSDQKQHTKRRKLKLTEDNDEKMSEVLDKPVEVTDKPTEAVAYPTPDNSSLEEELSLMERLLRTTEASSDKKLKKQRGRKPGLKKRDREHKTTSSDSTVQKSSSLESLNQKTSTNTNSQSVNLEASNQQKIAPSIHCSETNNSLHAEDGNIISEASSSTLSSDAVNQIDNTQSNVQTATSKCKSTKASVKEYTSIQDNFMIESPHNSEEELQTSEETQTVTSTTVQDEEKRNSQLDETSQDKSLSEDDLPLTYRLENSRFKVLQQEELVKKARTSTSSHKSDRTAKSNTKTRRDSAKCTGESAKELSPKTKRDSSKNSETTRRDNSKNRRDSSKCITDSKHVASKKDVKNRKGLNENKNSVDVKKTEQDSSVTTGKDSLNDSADKHNTDLSMQEGITCTEVVTKFTDEITESSQPESSKVSLSATSRRKKIKSQHPKRDVQHKTSTETQAETKQSSNLDNKTISKQKVKHTDLQSDVQVDSAKIQEKSVDKEDDLLATAEVVSEPSTPQSSAKMTVGTPAVTPSTPKTSAEGSRRRKLKKPVHSQDLKSRDTSLLVTEYTEERKMDQLPQNKVKPIQTTPSSSRKSSRSSSRNNMVEESAKEMKKNTNQTEDTVKEDKSLSPSSSKSSEISEDVVKKDKILKSSKDIKTDEQISKVTEVKDYTNEKLTIKPFKIESKMKYSARALKVREKLSAFAADFPKKRKNSKRSEDIPLAQVMNEEKSKFEPPAIVSDENAVNKMSVEEEPLNVTPTKSNKRKRTHLADIIRPKKSKLSFNTEEKIVKRPRGRPPKFPNQTVVKKELKEVEVPAPTVKPDLDSSTLDEINEICQEIQIEIVSEPITSTVIERPVDSVTNLRLNGLSNIETPSQPVIVEENTPVKKETQKKGSKVNQKERDIAKSLDSDSESNSELVIDTSAETSDEEEQTKMPSKRHWKKEKMYAMKNAASEQEKLAKSSVKQNKQVSQETTLVETCIGIDVVDRVEEVAVTQDCRDEPVIEEAPELRSESGNEISDKGLSNEKQSDSQDELVEPCVVPDIELIPLPESKEPQVFEAMNEVICNYTDNQLAGTSAVVSEEIITEKESPVENLTAEIPVVSVPTDTVQHGDIAIETEESPEEVEVLTEITTATEEVCTEVESRNTIPVEPVAEVTTESISEEVVSLPEDTETTPICDAQVITEVVVISSTEIPNTTEAVCDEIQLDTENIECNVTSEPEETIVSTTATEKLNVPEVLSTETEAVTEMEVVTETEAVTETEVVTETEAVTETEVVTEAEVVTETQGVTETEVVPETELVTETICTEIFEPEEIIVPETLTETLSVPQELITETVTETIPLETSVEYSITAGVTEIVEDIIVVPAETEIVEDTSVVPTETTLVIQEQTPMVPTEVVVAELQPQEEDKTETIQPENVCNLQQTQEKLQITEEIVSETHFKEEESIIPENQIVEVSDIPLPEETVVTETETAVSTTENTEHQVPETEVPVPQAEITVIHEETVVSAEPETSIPEITFAKEDICIFEDAECAETELSCAEMTVATVADTPEPERHVAETTSVELEMAEVIVVEEIVPKVHTTAPQLPEIHQAEIIEEFVAEDLCTTFELTAPVMQKLVEIIEIHSPVSPVALSIPLVLESCVLNTQTQDDRPEHIGKLTTTKCSVNGLQKTNKPVMVRQVEMVQYLQHMAETVDELIMTDSEDGIAQETTALSECYLTAESSCACIETSTQVQSAEKYPPEEIPADENYNLNILAHMAFNLVHLDTKTENNNVLGSHGDELSLRSDDMCLFVMLPDKQEDAAATATPVYVQKEGDVEKTVNIQKISTKGATLENKIQHLTELAAKKQPHPTRTGATENFNDLLTSLEDMLEVDNRKNNTVLPISEPEIPMIIPNTAHLHLIPDDDDFLMHQSTKKSLTDDFLTKKSPDKTPEGFTINLSLVSKSASQGKDAKTALDTSVSKDFYNEIENLDLSKTDEKRKSPKESKADAKSSKSKSKTTKSPAKPNTEASFLLSKYKSSYDKQSDTSAQQNSGNKNVISPPSYIRSTRPMRMVTTRKRKNAGLDGQDNQDKKSSTEAMFDKLLEEHKKEKATTVVPAETVVESGSTEIEVQDTVLNSTLMKFPPDLTPIKDSTAGTTKSSGIFTSSFSVASLLPEIATDNTSVTSMTAEVTAVKPACTAVDSNTITITSASTAGCNSGSTVLPTISTITTGSSVPTSLVSTFTSTSIAQSSISSLLSSTSVPQDESTVSPTKSTKSTKKFNILENIAVNIPVPPHDRSKGARLNIRDTLEFVKMPASQEEIRISYVKPIKAVLSADVDEENKLKINSTNIACEGLAGGNVNCAVTSQDKPDIIPLPVLEYIVPQPESRDESTAVVNTVETSDVKCLIPESVLNRSIEVVEKTIETLKQDSTALDQQSEVKRDDLIITQEPINVKESIATEEQKSETNTIQCNTKLKEIDDDKLKPDIKLIKDDNSNVKDVKISSDSTPKQEQSSTTVKDVQLIQEKSKPKDKQSVKPSSSEVKRTAWILDEKSESKLKCTDKLEIKLKETVKPTQPTETSKESVQEQSETKLRSCKDDSGMETAPVVAEVEICTDETVIVEDTITPSVKEAILAAETVKNQAVEVVTDWFDTKVAPEPYAEVTIEECQFFEEASNSSVTSHNQTTGVASVRKVYSKEYRTPDSGIAFDEDSVQKDKLETLTLADTEGYQSQTSPENPVETTVVPKATPELEIFKKPTVIVSIPLSKIKHAIDIILKAKKVLEEEHKTALAPLVDQVPEIKITDKLRKRKQEPVVVQEANEVETSKISDKLRKRKADTTSTIKEIAEPEPSKISDKLRKRKQETPTVDEVDKAKKKRITTVKEIIKEISEPVTPVDSAKSKRTTAILADKSTVTADDKKKPSKKDVPVIAEIKKEAKHVDDVPTGENDATPLVQDSVKKDSDRTKKSTETVCKDTRKRAQSIVEGIPPLPEDNIKKKPQIVAEEPAQADIVVKSEDKSKKRLHCITEDTPTDTTAYTETKDTDRVKKKRHNISDHRQTYTAGKDPTVETVKVIEKTKKRTPSASEDSQAENSDKEQPKDSHIDYNWIKKRRSSTVEEKKVESPEKDPLKNVDWIKKRRVSTSVEKPIKSPAKNASEQPRKRKQSIVNDDKPVDIASDTNDSLKNVDWIKKRQQSSIDNAAVSTEKDTVKSVDWIKKRRQSTVSEKSEASEKEKPVDWVKKRRQSVTDDTQSESEAGVKQDDYLTDKEWSSEEVMSPATSQATPVRSKSSKKDYPDCLFGITESPVPSASCCINSPYPSDISLQEEPTFYVEGGIDLCTDFQDQYYESFDSLKEQQSLQAGYSVVDEARKEQQSLQAGYCVVDSQFTLPEHMNDGDLISMIIENNMIIDKRMVAVNMHQVQPEMKPHSVEEQKRSEFDDFEPDNHLSGIVDGICRNLDSETVEFCQIDSSLLTGHDNSEVQLISMDQANSEVQVVICDSLQNMDNSLGTLLFDETAHTEIIQPGYTITTAVTETAHMNTETVTTSSNSTTGDQDAKVITERVDFPNTTLVEELPLCNHEIVIPMTESDPVVPIPITEEVIPTTLQSESVPKVQKPSTSYALQDDVIEATPKAHKPVTSFSYIRAKDKKQEEIKKTVKRSTENDLFSFATAANNKTERLLKIKLPTNQKQQQTQVVKSERSPKITSNADRLFENLKSQESIKEQAQKLEKSPRIQAATSPKLLSNADRLFDNLKSQKSGPIKVYTPRFASQKQNNSVTDQKHPDANPKLSSELKSVKTPEPKLADIKPSSPKLPGPKVQEVKAYSKVYETKKSEPKVNQRRNTDYDFDSLLASGSQQQQQRARTPKDYITRNGTTDPTKNSFKSSELQTETYRQRTTSTSSSSSAGEPSKYNLDQRKTSTPFKSISTTGEPTKYNIDTRRSTRYSPRIQGTSTSASRTQKFPSARVPAEEAVSRVPHRTHRSEPVYHMQRLDSSTYYEANTGPEMTAPTAASATVSTSATAKAVTVGIATNNNKNQPKRKQPDEKMWLTNPKLTELVEAANSYYSNKY